jgi:hypothetical protein
MTRTVIAVLVWVLAGCGDPYRDKLIDALGKEDPNFKPGPTHRPGQPCLACHSKYGGAKPEMVIGGTLFNEAAPGKDPFVVGNDYRVLIVDSEGERVKIQANQCGNFYITMSEWPGGLGPAFPLYAEILDNKNVQVKRMESRIGRDGSCAGCHIGKRTPYSAGVVYVPITGLKPPPSGACPPPWLGPDPLFPKTQ